MMEYKGYKATVEYDDSIRMLHGRVIGTRDVITFQGHSVEQLESAFADSIDDYLEFCKANGRIAERPASGNFMVRATPELHRRIRDVAARHGVSTNAFVVTALEQASAAAMTPLSVKRVRKTGKKELRRASAA